MTDSYVHHRQQLLRGLTFDQLLMARTIASSGSFREASKILCLTQPAISQRVHHIENVLGTPIFDRHAGVGVTLTEGGRTFLEFCDRAIEDLDELLLGLSTSGRVERVATLNISAPSDSIQHFLLRMIPIYKARYPKRRVRLMQSGSRAETAEMMRTGQADLAFYRVPVDETLDPVALMNERLYLVAAPGHGIFRMPVGERPGAIGSYGFATYSSSMRSRELVERWALKSGARLNVDIESKSLDIMKEAALYASALCVLPGSAISEEVAEGRLATVDIAGMPLPRATAIAVNSGAEQSATVREFLEMLIAYAHDAHDPLMPEIRWSASPRVHLRPVEAVPA